MSANRNINVGDIKMRMVVFKFYVFFVYSLNFCGCIRKCLDTKLDNW